MRRCFVRERSREVALCEDHAVLEFGNAQGFAAFCLLREGTSSRRRWQTSRRLWSSLGRMWSKSERRCGSHSLKPTPVLLVPSRNLSVVLGFRVCCCRLHERSSTADFEVVFLCDSRLCLGSKPQASSLWVPSTRLHALLVLARVSCRMDVQFRRLWFLWCFDNEGFHHPQSLSSVPVVFRQLLGVLLLTSCARRVVVRFARKQLLHRF